VTGVIAHRSDPKPAITRNDEDPCFYSVLRNDSSVAAFYFLCERKRVRQPPRMGNGPATRVYRPRQPRASPLFRLVESHFDQFQRVYPDRYQEKYGFWRPVVEVVVGKFLKCGDLHEGFARVRCQDCRHEFFVAFSFKQRCLCPSCHQKRALLLSMRQKRNLSRRPATLRRWRKFAVRKRTPTSANSAVSVGRRSSSRRSRLRSRSGRIYETDPLICPQCGGVMRVISFIERRQSELIRKILRHCGLWEEVHADDRAPPASSFVKEAVSDWIYEPDPEATAFADT